MESTDVEIRWRHLPPPEESKAYLGFHPLVTVLPVGHKRRENSRPLHEPMVFERDQTVRLRDGTKIYADIYRPTNETVVPAIMVWGPYGKSGSGKSEIGSMTKNLPADCEAAHRTLEPRFFPAASWCSRNPTLRL